MPTQYKDMHRSILISKIAYKAFKSGGKRSELHIYMHAYTYTRT